LITSRDKDITLQLLENLGLEHTCLSRARRRALGLLLEMVEHETRLLGVVRKFRPDVMLEIGGTFIVHAGKLARIPTIVFTDTENARLANRITFPFAGCVCTPKCFQGSAGSRQVIYDGYHELAYLHPNRFQPDPAVPASAGLVPGGYIVIRFVGWTAGHDIGVKGLSPEAKLKLVRTLMRSGRVIISSESSLPKELEACRMTMSPERVHHLLAFARLYVGESATMASESAVLGIPAIFISPEGRGYTDEEEECYGMVFNFRVPQVDMAIQRAQELLNRPNLGAEWQEKRRALLRDKIDVTAWMTRFVLDFVKQRRKRDH